MNKAGFALKELISLLGLLYYFIAHMNVAIFLFVVIYGLSSIART